jgi:hypothetical protein
MDKRTWKPYEITEIAFLAKVDPKTVRRHLVLGKPMRIRNSEAINAAAEKLLKRKAGAGIPVGAKLGRKARPVG